MGHPDTALSPGASLLWSGQAWRSTVDLVESKKTSSELQRLEVCAVSMSMCPFRDSSQVFSSSCMPLGFLYFSVQDTFGLWILMSKCYNLALMALRPLCKAFCRSLLEKPERHLFSFHILLKSTLHFGSLENSSFFRTCHTSFTFQ